MRRDSFCNKLTVLAKIKWNEYWSKKCSCDCCKNK